MNGNFDKISIFVAELSKDGKLSRTLGPIKLDNKIVKDAVAPDIIVTLDGRLRLIYYVGLFAKPAMHPKPNKFYFANSKDVVNFKIEGIVARLDGSSDPTVVRLNDGLFLMVVLQTSEMKITILNSPDGRSFKKSQ